jgi:phage baseplate assembly protein W
MTTLLGKGFNIPLKSGPRGLLDMVTDEALIDASISAILGTRLGERWMNPTFGCLLPTLLFEPSDAIFESLAYHYVTDALELNEPRIDILGMTFVYTDGSHSIVEVNVKYRIKATNAVNNKVYPFYRAGVQAA